jgi:hypothetical protein
MFFAQWDAAVIKSSLGQGMDDRHCDQQTRFAIHMTLETRTDEDEACPDSPLTRRDSMTAIPMGSVPDL